MLFRRIIASVGIVTGCVLLVALLLFAVAQSSRVQTAAVGAVLRQMEGSLQTHAQVDKVDYSFPNRLLIQGVYVEDQLGDTLLFVDTLAVRFDLWSLVKDGKVAFRRTDLVHTRLYAHTIYQQTDNSELDSCMNFQFLVDAFRNEEEREKKPFPIRLEVKNVSIRDLTLRYNDWQMQLAESALALNHLSADSLDAEVGHIGLTVSRDAGVPFVLKDFRGRLILADKQLYLPEVYVQLPRSHFLATDMSIHFGDSALFDPTSPVSFRMEDTHIEPVDFALFAPSLRSFRGHFDARAQLVGQVDSLHAANLSLLYNDQRILRGDVTANGLPNLAATDWNICCEDLFINGAMLQDLISNLKGKPFTLPKPVARLGNMHYRGTLSGQLHNLTLHGIFTSALGNITTNGTASVDSTYSAFAFAGDIATKRFALGKMLDNKDLGNAALSVHLNGQATDSTAFSGLVKANVEQLQFREYNYRDLRVNGCLHNQIFTGSFASNDPNINLAFNGLADFSNDIPVYDFWLVINHLRPGPLNLSTKYADADMHFVLTLTAKGKSLDTFRGTLAIDSFAFYHKGQTLDMQNFDLTVNTSSIRLTSDFVSSSLSGTYQLSTLPATLQRMIHRYVPSTFVSHKTHTVPTSQNNVDFYIYFHDLARLCSVLELPVTTDQMPTIKGFIHESEGQLALQAAVPELITSKQRIEDISLNINNRNQHINLALGALVRHSLNPASQKLGDLNLFLGAHAAADSLTLAFDWANPDTLHNAGSLNFTTFFRQYARKPLIALHIHPTEILLGDSLWQMEKAYLAYSFADTALQIDHFALHSSSQLISATGVASTREQDSIRAELLNIDLDYLLGALTDVHKSIYFGGTVTGWATAYGLFRNPMFEADVAMLNAKINGSEIGDVYATATLDKRKHVIINGTCYETFDSIGTKKVVEVLGDIGGPNHAWHLTIFPDSVRVGFINHWIQGYLADLDGRASGEVQVFGGAINDKPFTRVLVKAKAHNIGLTVPYTGGRYYSSDSVILDTTDIFFRNMTLLDEDGNPLQLNGVVHHDGEFRDVTFRFGIRANKAIVLDLPETPDLLYSGKIYATGGVRIEGDEKGCRIDASARTNGGSNVTIMTGGASTAANSDFVHFIEHSSPNTPNAPVPPSVSTAPADLYSLVLNLSIEATPEILARVVIDPRTGDQLRGHGEGNLRLAYNSADDNFSMFGTYTLNQGTFSFTLQNVIRREFEIASGSTVTWQGAPEEPILDAHAIYHLTASLRDLFGSDASQLYTNRASVPVNCLLNLSGVLTSPIISFGIELPSSDETIASQVRSIINTDDMITRQVLYLLVFNRFYTPEYLQNTRNVGLNETFSLLSSTVTGQINNWLGKVTNMFTLGFNIRTDGEGAAASQEYEAQFEIQPVRGLLINGNFGYRYNDIANQPIFGNLDVEYMLTRDGKLRAKAFTHTVDKYSLRKANTVQGVGLIYKHDFNWPTKQKE